MAKSLDFNKVPKQYLTVTLADEKKTTLMIGTPDKKTMEELILLQDAIEGMEEEKDSEKMDCLYSLCSRLMSRNKGGIEISKEQIETLFDFEDIIIFFNAYMSFIDEVMTTKN